MLYTLSCPIFLFGGRGVSTIGGAGVGELGTAGGEDEETTWSNFEGGGAVVCFEWLETLHGMMNMPISTAGINRL